MDLEAFDLDDALAVAEESRRRFAASNSFVSNLPAAAPVHDKDDGICSVCMEGFDRNHSTDSQGSKRMPCGHVYHASCIITWLSLCNSCPLCRSEISVRPI